jgi:hypothetical protein
VLHLYDRATMAHALTLPLDPALHAILGERIGKLDPSLIGYTEYLVIEPGDTEGDIRFCVGFSPLIEPIDGFRFGEAGFHPFWDWLGDHGGWYEMIVTFGSTFAYVVLVANADGVLPALLNLCQQYAEAGTS